MIGSPAGGQCISRKPAFGRHGWDGKDAVATGILLSYAAGLLACGVAALAFWREPKRRLPSYSFAAGLILLGVESLLAGQCARARAPQDMLAWARATFLVTALLPAAWMAFSLTYARGNGREFLGRWKIPLFAALILPPGALALGWADLLGGGPGEGPHAMRMLPLGAAGVLLNAILVLAAVICLMHLEATLRESKGTMRWRVKYMIVGVGLVFVARCYGALQAVLYAAVNVDLAGWSAGGLALGCLFMLIALARGPLGAVDLYPSPRAPYGSLTVVVAGAYLLAVGGLAEAAAYVESSVSFPLLSLLVLAGACGIAMALLSDRLRLRAKRFANLYFHRPRYDYRHLWTAFTERTASLGDAQEFCRAVTRLMSELLETLAVTVWLVDERGRRLSLGGSTSVSEAEARDWLGDGRIGADVAPSLRVYAHPTAVRDVPGAFGDWLRRLGRKTFEAGGESYFLPLKHRDEVLGLLVLGDRVGGVPFTAEEFALMRTLGIQIVASLLRYRLSSRLADARKLEAFQTLSAFFVHDLKNTAATLSLMLQNLPRHFDDPGFRQDALRSIGKGVDRINALIGRLGCFRPTPDMKPVVSDLNAMVRTTLAGLPGCGPERVTLDLRPVPALPLDPDQFPKVITNLALNARDALGEDGRIAVGTRVEDGGVTLTVADNGCGMTPEFVAQSLFRPFQTTKPGGIGIGLFHSKTIVEAHGGTLDCASRPGEGSTFRVWLQDSGGTT
jgi:signal transduction histidine kinase